MDITLQKDNFVGVFLGCERNHEKISLFPFFVEIALLSFAKKMRKNMSIFFFFSNYTTLICEKNEKKSENVDQICPIICHHSSVFIRPSVNSGNKSLVQRLTTDRLTTDNDKITL